MIAAIECPRCGWNEAEACSIQHEGTTVAISYECMACAHRWKEETAGGPGDDPRPPREDGDLEPA